MTELSWWFSPHAEWRKRPSPATTDELPIEQVIIPHGPEARTAQDSV